MDGRPRELILSVPMWLGWGLDWQGRHPVFRLPLSSIHLRIVAVGVELVEHRRHPVQLFSEPRGGGKGGSAPSLGPTCISSMIIEYR